MSEGETKVFVAAPVVAAVEWILCVVWCVTACVVCLCELPARLVCSKRVCKGA